MCVCVGGGREVIDHVMAAKGKITRNKTRKIDNEGIDGPDCDLTTVTDDDDDDSDAVLSASMTTLK